MKQHNEHLKRFYEVLDELRNCQGDWALKECRGNLKKSGFPERGVYFFFEDGENLPNRSPRVVRVGSHRSISSKLRTRLDAHRGRVKLSGGDHRTSVFRKLIGKTLMEERPSREYSLRAKCSWGIGESKKEAVEEKPSLSSVDRIKEQEHLLECVVSERLGNMKVLVLAVNSAKSLEDARDERLYIERNAIGLLSCARKRSKNWLGRHSHNPKVESSGLWNEDHINGGYDPKFLKDLARYAAATTFKFPKST